MLITRLPYKGCLSSNNITKTVDWQPINQCSPDNLNQRWKWFQVSTISSAESNLCIEVSPNIILSDLKSDVWFFAAIF